MWTAESSDLSGLVTEAASLNELDAKRPNLIRDLLSDAAGDVEVAVEIIASLSRRIEVGASSA